MTNNIYPHDAIFHQALFWLKNPGSDADRASLIAGLRTLSAIPQIKALSIAVPASTESRDVVDASFDVHEMMVFDGLDDQKTYQDHPVHQAFISTHEHLWDRVVVYDSLGV
jgi:hypothetical protein